MVPFQRPQLPSATEIDRYMDLSREAAWFSNSGPCWHLLRERLSDRVGAYCVPVASGTLGLMAALAAALPGRPGPTQSGAALMPAFTFVATALAAGWVGLRPQFGDIAKDHWHLDPTIVEAALARGDKAAVIPVSAFGTPPPPEVRLRWEAACRGAGVPLIVDSAAGFGSVAEDGVQIGAQGDLEVVSFHATKPFAIGEGGAVFTRSRELGEKVERIVNFGFGPNHAIAQGGGINAKMSELHAATALAVLDGYDAVLERRRALAARIQKSAGSAVGWQEGCARSTWQFVPVVLSDSGHRDRLIERCRGNVEVRTYYEPLSEQLGFGAISSSADLRRTDDLSARILCLPMANDLDDVEVTKVAAVLADT